MVKNKSPCVFFMLPSTNPRVFFYGRKHGMVGKKGRRRRAKMNENTKNFLSFLLSFRPDDDKFGILFLREGFKTYNTHSIHTKSTIHICRATTHEVLYDGLASKLIGYNAWEYLCIWHWTKIWDTSSLTHHSFYPFPPFSALQLPKWGEEGYNKKGSTAMRTIKKT